MKADRSLRRLTALQDSASTSRVLNLLITDQKHSHDLEFLKSPLFKNKVLNRSIIVKHRLRPDEYSNFKSPPSNVLKILFPIDGADLRYGAHSIFVGQTNYEKLLKEYFGDDLKPGSRDRVTLELIGSLPTLDPFLLREHLKRNGIDPAREYFAISDSDQQRMFNFVRTEIMDLVTLSGGGDASVSYASRLVEKLLSNSPEAGFEPLRDTLRLNEQEYRDGMFSWRGFLYYKWVLTDLLKPMHTIMVEIDKVRGRGAKSPETEAYIRDARVAIQEQMASTFESASRLIKVYDDAYAGLTHNNRPNEFRTFLLSAPTMFNDLGEQLGALQHIISFWRYRFPLGEKVTITPDEIMDIFMDFEDSLA